MSRQPFVIMGRQFCEEVAVETDGRTASRRIRTEEEINRGDALARPEEVNGVIPGAVDVVD
jgi:phage host-nuclease inhibitor protein Gam